MLQNVNTRKELHGEEHVQAVDLSFKADFPNTILNEHHMTSLNIQVKRCAGLLDTKDLSDWEDDFILSIVERTDEGDNTTSLTEKQIEVLERIHNKHFAG